MTADNLIYATDSMRSSVSSLKRKLSNLRVQIEVFDAEIEKMEAKFSKVLTQAEIYKAKLEREMGREVRRLTKELANLKKSAEITQISPADEDTTNLIASTVAIMESILGLISDGAEDFHLISKAFLFPAIIERVMTGIDEAYYMEEVPESAGFVVDLGRVFLSELREKHPTYLTNPEVWENVVNSVVEWWKDDALPALYGSKDSRWDIDVPLTLAEMRIWDEKLSERPRMFPLVFDAYEIYAKNLDRIYESSGLRQFELDKLTSPTP